MPALRKTGRRGAGHRPHQKSARRDCKAVPGDPGTGPSAVPRNCRSSASRKRERSALVNPLPPPCRNGSAARRSAIRSRVASALPTLASVSAAPSGLSTRAPAATHFAASGMSPVTTTSPRPARSAIHCRPRRGPRPRSPFRPAGFARAQPAVRHHLHAQRRAGWPPLHLGLDRAGIGIDIDHVLPAFAAVFLSGSRRTLYSSGIGMRLKASSPAIL